MRLSLLTSVAAVALAVMTGAAFANSNDSLRSQFDAQNDVDSTKAAGPGYSSSAGLLRYTNRTRTGSSERITPVYPDNPPGDSVPSIERVPADRGAPRAPFEPFYPIKNPPTR